MHEYCARDGLGRMSLTALELGVGGVDTSVDDVHASVGTGSGVVDVRGGTLGHVGNAAETPGSTSLGRVGLLLQGEGLGGVSLSPVGLDNGVLLNVLNLCGISVLLQFVWLRNRTPGSFWRSLTMLSESSPAKPL